ncbi:MAG TPA: patatin-like protein, partial [Actinomycetota bacterium]|nr:patatin-like protein [Actinomycetota bacterium]
MATIVTTPPDDREELRLALALNGGLSLAIWIGGVSMEINRLVRGESVYGELLELTQSTARVDVMAGASAGGINGALLGMAIAHDQSLERIRSVWLDEGGMMALFRSPFQSDPPSLFRGDEYFLERLRKVFGEFVTTKPSSTEEHPIDLIMTTTMLRGERLDFDDEFGNTIHDVIHRGQFRFKRQGDRDDFRTKADAERLALAARSTASFPGAFEASFIPVGERTDGPERPDMKAVANFTTSRYVIDGGVLVNKPIGPVLRTIFALPAEQQVRRVLAYVVPDPGMPPRAGPQRPDQPPAMAEALLSGVTLPRVESIGLDLEELRDHNRRVKGQQRLRDVLLWERMEGRVKLLPLADRLFLPYRDSRVENTVEYMLGQLTVGTRALDAGEGVTPHGWSRADLRRELRRAVGDRIPRAFPGRQASLRDWPWDVKTVEGVAGIVMSLLKEGLEVAVPDGDPSWAAIRTDLREGRRQLAAEITRLRRIRDRDIGYWKDQAAAFGAVTGTDLGPQAARSVDGWFAVLDGLPEIPEVAARVLVRSGPALWAVVTRSKSYAPRDRDQLVAELEGLAVPMDGDEAAAGSVLRLLLALAVIQQALSAGQPVLEQPVALIQVSADTPNGFDSRERAEDKLAGIQLGHFGAFYKRSWRANDWMWGRLDGAWRLAQVVLSPERLRKLALATGKPGPDRLAMVVDAIESIALGLDAAAHPVLRPRWNREAVEEELRFIALDAPDPEDVPASLPEAAAAVARRIQLEVLTGELKHLADAIEADRDV